MFTLDGPLTGVDALRNEAENAVIWVAGTTSCPGRRPRAYGGSDPAVVLEPGQQVVPATRGKGVPRMKLQSKAKTAARSPALMCIAAFIAASALGATPLARGQEPSKSEPAELLSRAPFDDLILIDNAKFEIEPISPRPIPPRNADAAPPQPAAPPAEPGAEPAPVAEDTDELIIHLIEGDQKDFRVKRANIKEVDYWEDKLLAEGERLVRAHNFAKAFEYYLSVEARNPKWRGLSKHIDDLLFTEGDWVLTTSNDRARGLRLLQELQRRTPDYPGLAARLGEAYAGQIEEAIANGTYAYGRQILHELVTLSPNSPLISDLRNRFVQRARSEARRADNADGPRKLDLLTDSLRIWPDQPEVVTAYERAFAEAPTLDVGVLDVPRPVAPWVNSPASARVTPLLYLPILRNESDEALLGELPGQLSEGLELGDLGRRIELRIRPGIIWSDGTREVSTIDFVRALSDRAQPRSPAYNARWAALLERIEESDDDVVTIRLARSPLSSAWWLLAPVGPAHASWDGRVATPSGRLPVGDGPFVFVQESDGRILLAAREAEAPHEPGQAGANLIPQLPAPSIRRIREVRLDDTTEAMSALERGEISLLDHVPPDRVEGLQANPEYSVGHYRQPSLHRLAIDGRNPLLKDRLLRRGIAYAIDRKTILEEVVLRRPIDEVNRPMDGAFPVDSYANAAGVSAFDSNMLQAKGLIVGAKQVLGVTRINLTLRYPAIPEARAAVPRIVEALTKAGLQIEPIELRESELEAYLRAGGRFDLAYRATRIEEPVFEVGPLLCPGFDAPPASLGLAALASPRILQLLLQLEQAPEWETARELVSQIDAECRFELPIIPLWQLRDHYAWRSRLTGPSATTDRLYDGLQGWEIKPWYPRDPWSSSD